MNFGYELHESMVNHLIALNEPNNGLLDGIGCDWMILDGIGIGWYEMVLDGIGWY